MSSKKLAEKIKKDFGKKLFIAHSGLIWQNERQELLGHMVWAHDQDDSEPGRFGVNQDHKNIHKIWVKNSI